MFEGSFANKIYARRSQQLTLRTMHSHKPDGATFSSGCCGMSWRMRVFWTGCPSLTPPYGEFLEHRGEFKLVKTTLNAKSFTRRLSRSLSIDFGAISSWNVCRSQKLDKKSIKTSILAFNSGFYRYTWGVLIRL